jgi:hypothetical protein
MTPEQNHNPSRPVSITLNGGRVCEGFRAALFDAAGREGKSVNEVVLEAAGEKLRSAGYQFPSVFPEKEA